MIKNYLITNCNNLLKSKLYSLINIIGLSVGLAACVLILLYVQNETSYDEHWENADRIFRVTTTMHLPGSEPRRYPVNSLLLLPALQEYFGSEIEAGARVITFNEREIYVGDMLFEQAVSQVGPELIAIFEFDELAGSLETTLANPNNIALSAAVAERLFGTVDAVGKTMTIVRNGTREDFQVSAVYRLPEGNTVLELPALRLTDPDRVSPGWLGPLLSNDYILFRPGVDPAQVSTALKAYTDQNLDISGLGAGPGVNPSERVTFQLQNISDIYLRSPFEGNSGARGNTSTVLAFSAIAVLVLLIGCINFTVLSTAKAIQRAKEVAMRKTIGATRPQLVVQFLGESFLIVLMAMCVSLAIVELVLPVFEAMVNKTLLVSFTSFETLLWLFGLFLTAGLLGGLYPAFVLSRFRPAVILKSERSADKSNAFSLKTLLVTFQFGIAIALIVATAVIYLQLQFVMTRNPGFNKDNLLVVERLSTRNLVNENKETLRQEVSSLPGVSSASLSGHQPMQRYGASTYNLRFTVEGAGSTPHNISLLSIDDSFLDTYQIPIIAGRNFNENQDMQQPYLFSGAPGEEGGQGTIILNASAARDLGFVDVNSAIGQTVSTPGLRNRRHDLTVVGVIEDTQFFTLRNEARAEAYVLADTMTDVLTIRYRGNPQEVYSRVNGIWRSLMGDLLMTTSYVDQNMDREFAQEQLEARMLLSFSLLAVVIAGLGLYGSASFTVDRRTKEIGIRKVMGAEVREIVSLLMWQFSKPVLVANVIAWPAAVWVMLTWLQRFPYQIDTLLLIPLCVLAGAIALSIAWLTVAGNTVKVATTNPVYALRYE